MAHVFTFLYQGISFLVNKDKTDGGERSSDASDLIGKKIYSRRRKLGCKRPASFFQSVSMRDTKQTSKRARRNSYAVKDTPEAAEVEKQISSLEKKVSEHDSCEPSANAAIPGKKRPSLHICNWKSEEVDRAIQGIVLHDQFCSQKS